MDADFLLIRKIEKGNEQAMDQFVLKHYPKIYQYCLLRVRDHGYAEDLTQETFLKFFQDDREKQGHIDLDNVDL